MNFSDYRDLFEQANDAIALVEFDDGVPVIREANPKFYEVFAPESTDLGGTNLDEIVASGEQIEQARDLTRRVQEGEKVRKQVRRQTADGPCEFLWQVIPIDADDTQSAEAAFAIYTDISDRVEQERELEETKERYRRLLESAPNPILIYSADSTLIYTNDSGVEFLGAQDRDELIGLELDEFAAESSQADIQDRWTELLEDGEPVAPMEVTVETLDGNTKQAIVASSPIIWEGKPAVQTVATDITEVKRREQELHRYETLVEVAGDPMYMLDPDGRFRYVNEALLDLTGQAEDDLLGEHVEVVMDVEDVERGEELIRSLLEARDRRGTFEMDLVTANGDRIPSENHISLLFDDGEFDGTVGVLRDISDRLQRERQLQRERDRLDEFAGVVSHDLRNPLNVAKGRLELAAEDSDSEDLDTVARAHDRMEALIEDLLTLARAGSEMGQPEQIDLAEFLQNCWRNIESENATLEIEIDGTIQADKSRLKQLFENLFRNAVEHAGPDVTVRIGGLPNGFYVEDDGPGFDDEALERVLEPGYSSSEGTGFGLSIVRSIAEAHGWSLAVRNVADGGARFEFTGIT